MGATHRPERSPEARASTDAQGRGSTPRLSEAVRQASLRRAVFGAFAAVLLIVAGVFGVLALSIGVLRQDAVRDGRSEEVLQSSNMSERLVIDLETGLRGYLLTGQRRFLEPYSQALLGLAQQLPRLEVLVNDNPAQLARARGISSAVASYERFYAAPLAHGNGRLIQPQEVASTLAGKRLVDAMRRRFAAFNQQQQRLSSERRRATAANALTATLMAVGGFALIALLLAMLATYLARAVLTPIQLGS
jgi:CHASE3 domain sensor protein